MSKLIATSEKAPFLHKSAHKRMPSQCLRGDSSRRLPRPQVRPNKDTFLTLSLVLKLWGCVRLLSHLSISQLLTRVFPLFVFLASFMYL